MFRGRYLKIVVINTAVSIAVVISLWIASGLIYKMELTEDARLSELSSTLSSAGTLKNTLIKENQQMQDVQSLLEDYEDEPIDKEIFLKELTTMTDNVEVVRFSEILPVQTENTSVEPAENELGDLLSAKKFSLVLYGNNTALYETMLALKALRKNYRITDTRWCSDFAAQMMPKIPGKITLVEAMSDSKFLNTYNSNLQEFTENSTLSFSIEFFCPEFTMLELGSVNK